MAARKQPPTPPPLPELHTPLIDTHAHLYSSKFNADRDEAVARARPYLAAVLLPNIDLDSLEPLRSLTNAYPRFCYPMAGLHPCHVPQDPAPLLEKLEAELSSGLYWAVGETGTDRYWDTTYWDQQLDSLRTHVAWAKRFDLPLVLHCRDSVAETLELLEPLAGPDLRGVFHCWSGNLEQARQAIAMGFHLGFGGTLTHKQSDLPQQLPQLDTSRLLLETDAPYLAPRPLRGQRNEPVFMLHVAQQMAQALDQSIDQVAARTTANAIDLFRLPLEKPTPAN